MKRKVLSLLVVAAMAVTMLAGCGGSSDKAADSGDGSKKELNILMEQVPDTDYVLELLDKYEEETGVKVNVEAVNYEIMHEKSNILKDMALIQVFEGSRINGNVTVICLIRGVKLLALPVD